MARYIYNPNSITVGVNPIGNGWTMRLGTFGTSAITSGATPVDGLGGEGDRFWRSGRPATAQYVLARFDAVPNNSEIVEVLSLQRRSATEGGGNLSRVNESGSVNGYYLGLRNNTDQVRGRLWTDSVAANMGSELHGLTMTAASWVWIRSQSTGSTQRAKAWLHGTTEPAWQLEQTESTYASGGAGHGDYLGSGTDIDIAWFSVGTGGDAAPDSDVEPRKITITGLKAPNTANDAVANAAGIVQVKLWIDKTDTDAPDHLVTDATITSGAMTVNFDTAATVGTAVLGVAKWTVSTDDYFFPIEATVQEVV